MPLYEYECGRCGGRTTHLVRGTHEVPERCDACGSRRLERQLSTFSVKNRRPADERALHGRPRDYLERPERLGEAMRALGERTGLALSSERVDDAMHRLSEAKKGS